MRQARRGLGGTGGGGGSQGAEGVRGLGLTLAGIRRQRAPIPAASRVL